ncbi:MAG: mandelate racemase [Candidatus Dormibacteraeota bacterium]|nr:mandelate racemase [Candidatus Dormibacteraeota bacterium]
MQAGTITGVEIWELSGTAPPPGALQQQVKPLDIYAPPSAEPRRSIPGAELRHLYLEIETSLGVSGLYGPIDRSAAWVVFDQLAPFLLGRDGLATSTVWDRLDRLDRHSRHGHFKMGISAVDNALWDLRGRVEGLPVYRLLGGPSRERLPVYASTLGTGHDPATIESTVKDLVARGFRHQKWFFAHGPGDGAAGLEADLAMTEQVRGAAGPRVRLMFDAFGGWDLTTARAWAQEAEAFRPTWLEEPFPASRIEAYRALRASTTIPLAAGEHLYDRAEVLPWLRDGILSVLQTDPEWCGGVTELTRLCALAEPFGVPVIPHGHGLHAALHVAAGQSPGTCPLVEYLLHTMPRRYHFELDPPLPEDGHLTLPSRPGFGIAFDESRVAVRRRWPFEKEEDAR